MTYQVYGYLGGDRELFAAFPNEKDANRHIEKLKKAFSPKYKWEIKERKLGKSK